MGVTYFISEGLRKLGHDVSVINLRDRHRFLTFLMKSIRFFIKGKPSFYPLYSRIVNRMYQREIERNPYDLIFTFGFMPYSYLESDLPKICWTDATFQALLDFHPFIRGWGDKFVKWARMLDQRGADACTYLIFSSEWARRSYLVDMKGDESKSRVIPFGGNLPEEPEDERVERAIEEKLDSDEIRLLFIGLKWVAKGGVRLLEIARGIKESGHKVRVDVVGVKPEVPDDLRQEVHLHGFVSKKEDKGWELLQTLLYRAHYYVMLSEGESYGHVYCEANAFGVPALAYDIAGAAEIIREGVNGNPFPIETKVTFISNYIVKTFSLKEEYRRLCMSSREEYKSRLSWNAAYSQLGEVLDRFTPH